MMIDHLPTNWSEELIGVLRRHAARISATFFLTLLIFVLDTVSNPNSSIAVLYVLVIVIAAEIHSGAIIKASSLLCGMLALGSYIIDFQGSHTPLSVLQLGLALFTNIITTVLLVRKVQDREVLEAQARLLEMTNEAIVLRDPTGRIIFWNRGAQQLYGFSAEEVLGKSPGEPGFAHFAASQEISDRHLQCYDSWQGEQRVRTKSGDFVQVYSYCKIERTPGGKISTLSTASADITSKKRGEMALKESEERYRTIFETLAVGVWEHDFRPFRKMLQELSDVGVTNLREHLELNPALARRAMKLISITDVNKTGLKLMNVDRKDEFPRSLDEVLPEDDRGFVDFMVAFSEGQKNFQFDSVVLNREGQRIPVTVALSVSEQQEAFDRVHMSVLDIRERFAFQEALEASRRELDHATRAAVIGEVSASIAHEVSQPLTAISTYTQAALRWLNVHPPEMGEAKGALREGLEAIENAAAVVNRVRLLLGKAKPLSAEVPLEQVINQALRFKQVELTSACVRVSLLYERCDTVIHGDRVLLQQAFINIIGNAIEALVVRPPADRRLVVRVVCDADDVHISFEDNGTGLVDIVPEALFKPFSTSKPAGMGLGLAMCKSVAIAHNGRISIRNSDHGPGAVVEMKLRCRAHQGPTVLAAQ